MILDWILLDNACIISDMCKTPGNEYHYIDELHDQCAHCQIGPLKYWWGDSPADVLSHNYAIPSSVPHSHHICVHTKMETIQSL